MSKQFRDVPYDGLRATVDPESLPFENTASLALNRKIPILVRRDLFRRKLSEEEIKEYEGLVKSVKF